ncbi:hypothetical protein [Vagococcus carniphilus]|uniref:hypothetical protein n=1 Tax=Vagococcus carniphilus TaxID=218144 RepID=UPI003BAD8102
MYRKVLPIQFVFLCIVIVITEVKPFKKAVISIITFIENNISKNISENTIRNVYTFFREIAIILVFILFIIFILYTLVRPVLERISQKDVYGGFEESLTKYLDIKNELYAKKGYLVSGEWGSGKSYIVNRFFDDHYKFSKRPIYRVSCFGLDSREAVIKEIEKQIEINDNSLLNWTQYIPIIGLPIFSLLKKSYSLENISSDAIFIFDDFERITSIGIDDDSIGIQYNRRINSSFGRNDHRNALGYSEFENTNKEFRKIQESFNKLASQTEEVTLSTNLQKYNIVTGLINELIENIGAKVIIVCNTDIIGNHYMDKVFRGKMDCITYNKFSDEIAILEIFNSVLNNYVFVDKISKELIQELMPEILEDFDIVWNEYKNKNLRDIKTFFQAFLEMINLIEIYNEINREIIISVFYSVYYVKILEKNIKYIENLPIGSNLLFNIKADREHSDYQIFKRSNLIKEARWIGHLLSSYWLLNLPKPNNIEILLEKFESYLFKFTENVLINYENMDILEYNIELLSARHFVYILKLEELENKTEKTNILIKQVKSKFEDWIQAEKNQHEPNHILFLNELNKKSSFTGNYLNYWFSIIFINTSYEGKDDDGFAFTLYRNYIKTNVM